MTSLSAREFIEHLERTIDRLRAELVATVDRLDAATAMREMYFAADTDEATTADEAVAAMTPTETDRARFAALGARITTEPKEHDQ